MQLKRWIYERGLVAVIAAFACAGPAMAVNYSCGGAVNGVTVGPGGTLSAANAGGQSWGYFCQIGATTNNISSDACKGMLAVLLAAQASGKQVVVWYSDDHDCAWHAANGAWQWLSTVYWGPAMME